MEHAAALFLLSVLIAIGWSGAQQNIYSSKQAYLEAVTKGTEFSCMKNCVPPDRKRYVEENYYPGPDPRPPYACDKNNERPVDNVLCKMSPALVSNLTYIAGSMYMFPNLTINLKYGWHAALKFCRSFGQSMQLASIINEKENNAIAKFLGDQKPPASANIAKDSFWTSGTNLGDELTWIETGEVITWTNWVGGKQSTTSGKVCIQVALDKGKMVWKDVDCFTENRVICEVTDECYKNTCDG